jgi:hypothetical protein
MRRKENILREEAGLRGFQLLGRNFKNGVIDRGFIGGKMIGFDECKRGENMLIKVIEYLDSHELVCRIIGTDKRIYVDPFVTCAIPCEEGKERETGRALVGKLYRISDYCHCIDEGDEINETYLPNEIFHVHRHWMK